MKKYRGTQCSAFGCSKRKKRKSGVDGKRSDSEGSDDEESALKREHPRTFHAFPSDDERRKIWLKNMHRGEWQPTRHSRLCSDHFKEQFVYRAANNVTLRPNAVPTRFKSFPKYLKKIIEKSIIPTKQVVQTENVEKPTAVQPQVSTVKHDFCLRKILRKQSFIIDHTYCIRSPKRLKMELDKSHDKISQLKRQLKSQQQKSRRLNSRVRSLKSTVKVLRKKVSTLETNQQPNQWPPGVLKVIPFEKSGVEQMFVPQLVMLSTCNS